MPRGIATEGRDTDAITRPPPDTWSDGLPDVGAHLVDAPVGGVVGVALHLDVPGRVAGLLDRDDAVGDEVLRDRVVDGGHLADVHVLRGGTDVEQQVARHDPRLHGAGDHHEGLDVAQPGRTPQQDTEHADRGEQPEGDVP